MVNIFRTDRHICFLATMTRKKKSIANCSTVYLIGIFLFLFIYIIIYIFFVSLSLWKIKMALMKFILGNTRGLNTKEQREKKSKIWFLIQNLCYLPTRNSFCREKSFSEWLSVERRVCSLFFWLCVQQRSFYSI